ncbi:lactonase family protein [Glycomyces harbinensis]|uniref:6-phosphogluconolactonase n=1 Tax=Glycomyces harbinensis TaxID=58114 RepID=A0A1G6RJL7_9ACTN|nr:beta-propeller fold lactonase family protein [Glycomyces harbinensis]SDD04839.1 6-phosphogluconolactonase [Glycomyces harbinensis]
MRYLLGDYTTEGGPGLVVAGPDGLGDAAAVVNPSWVHVGPEAVYTLTETEPGFAAAWRLGADFTLDRVGQGQSTGGNNPCHATVDPSGRWLLVANYGASDGAGASVAVLPIGDDGQLGPAADVFKLSGSGPEPDRQSGPHAHQVVCHKGRVLAVDLGSDRVHAFDLGEDGKLTPAATTALEPGFGPRHLAFIGDRAVIAGELSNAVAVGTFDERSATFSFGPAVALPGDGVADYAALPDIGLDEGAPPPAPAAVVADPERDLVYITVRGTDQLVAVDPADGSLVRSVPVGAAWPRDAVLTADGTLLVACQHTGAVTRVDPTGETEPVIEWSVPGVTCVAPLS